MGLLDGGLSAAIYTGFKGKLLKGVLRRNSSPDSAGLDELGDPLDIEADEDIAIEGFVDRYSAFTLAQPGFPQTDLKVCIFAGSCPGVSPRGNNLVRFDYKGGARWFRIRDGDGGVKTDPATALWECQAYEIEAPL